jgi:aspartate carbamoyltransferase catalytic subunit
VSLAGRSLISVRDLGIAEVDQILDLADEMARAIGFDDPDRRTPARPLDRVLATLFFEPSTRTRLSFESAMLRLGGQVLGFSDPSASSVQKGETLADTIRMAAGYADIIVIRHPKAGSARVAAESSSVPVINGGDGPHEHPTQTLTDLFCIRRSHGTLAGLRLGLCGDLKYGRTVHSLAPTMARYGSDVVCIAPDALQMPSEVLAEVQSLGGRYEQTADLAAALGSLDVLYMTRVQRERFDDPAEYEQFRGSYVLTPELMAEAPAHLSVLHPLPRVDEIAVGCDADPRAKYFIQAAGGVPVRMALISLLLGTEGPATCKGAFRFEESPRGVKVGPASEPDRPRREERITEGTRCTNPKCITSTEAYLQPLTYEEAGHLRCAYCEERSVQKGLF